ncbi:hypothetical protein, partial [Paraburkholderia sp. JHI869]|uniref:hypothetical protein n=1 Tax=Paraburkholderia sp. JHI869 TaxID=3112959 RepID=UPI00317ACCF6
MAENSVELRDDRLGSLDYGMVRAKSGHFKKAVASNVMARYRCRPASHLQMSHLSLFLCSLIVEGQRLKQQGACVQRTLA